MKSISNSSVLLMSGDSDRNPIGRLIGEVYAGVRRDVSFIAVGFAVNVGVVCG